MTELAFFLLQSESSEDPFLFHDFQLVQITAQAAHSGFARGRASREVALRLKGVCLGAWHMVRAQ